MIVYLVIWICLMMFWIFGVGYWTWEPARPYLIGGVLIPWLAVLILGLIVFGAVNSSPPPIR